MQDELLKLLLNTGSFGVAGVFFIVLVRYLAVAYKDVRASDNLYRELESKRSDHLMEQMSKLVDKQTILADKLHDAVVTAREVVNQARDTISEIKNA